MEPKKNILDSLTHNYQLILRDEESLRDLNTFHITKGKVFSLISIVVFVSLFLGSWVGYKMSRTSLLSTGSSDDQIIEMAMQIDSLELVVQMNEEYMSNINNLVRGNIEGNAKISDKEQNEAEKAEDVASKNTESQTNLKNEMHPVDSVLRSEFENSDYSIDVIGKGVKNELHRMVFFPPLSGLISKSFDVKEPHFGVDVVAAKNEPIKAVSDGTIILASWTQDSGNVIAIQHTNQLISLYKHNSVLLKEVGDVVRAGDPVAIIGNTGEYTDGPHLHFELWYRGNPVNPENYLTF